MIDERRAKQEVLGRIASDREFGEGHDVTTESLRLGREFDDARDVAVEIPDDGVALREADTHEGHGSRLRRPDIGNSLRVVEPRPAAALDALVERCAAPASARASLDHLADAHPDLLDRLHHDEGLARTLVAVLAASRSLTRTIESRTTEAMAVLADPFAPVIGAVDTPGGLVAWRDLEFLRIATADLTGRVELESVGSDLSALGRSVLSAAHAIAMAEAGDALELAVIGMGKLAGDELNYSSDIDIMFVGEGDRTALERCARRIMELARSCFRVDANLRPEGRDGQLVRSVDSYRAYWDRWAEPWEFQALLKARPAAGSIALGEQWFDAAQHALWSRPFDAQALRSLRAMKERAEAEVARKGLTTRELKRGPGGIRDIEFTIQLLQLVHGHLDDELRGANTLDTLREMTDAGYIDDGDGESMAAAYRLLRTVEHRLQLVDEQQVHTLPVDERDLDHLARVMGMRDDPKGTAAEQLERELRHTQAVVRGIHERVYFRPLLEAFAVRADDGALSDAAAEARLSAFGFTDAKRTEAAMRELTRGLNRSSRLMQQLLPLLLDWLSQSPDPDLGLLVVRNLLTGPRFSRPVIETFRDSPAAARSLCALAGTSGLLGSIITQNPDLISRLPDPELLATKGRDGLIETATASIEVREGIAEQQPSLRRWQQRNLLGIAARDVFDVDDIRVVGRDLTALAEASVQAALDVIEPRIPVCVLGLGRFGGGELSYASDLDIVFVHEGTGSEATDEARRVATMLLKVLGGATPSDRIYAIDADLRPEGRNGPLSRTIPSYLTYWRDFALTWERQAMTRARVIAGDPELGGHLLDALDPYVWEPGLSLDDEREIRRMKARIESERMAPGEDPDFHLKLGRGSLSDIEFTAQMLQLRYGVREPSTLGALSALESAGHLSTADCATLVEAYEFCERVRNRWFLVNSAPSDSLPGQPEQSLWLARSLDTTPGALREDYRRLTRRARRVVERVFYGVTDD